MNFRFDPLSSKACAAHLMDKKLPDVLIEEDKASSISLVYNILKYKNNYQKLLKKRIESPSASTEYHGKIVNITHLDRQVGSIKRSRYYIKK